MDSTPIPSIHITMIRGALAALATEAQDIRGTVGGFQSHGAPVPEALLQWIQRVEELKERLNRVGVGEGLFVNLPRDDVALVRTAVAAQRRARAHGAERTEHFFHSPTVRSELTTGIKEHDTLLDGPLAAVLPNPKPVLGDYFTVEGLENRGTLPPRAARERDPKHRVLLSSSLLSGDIASHRRHCEERRARLGVLFVDLDSFKAINTALGEVVVDRTVLPQVLTAVERAVFGHGDAYRHGGDEFVILLPNTNEAHAVMVSTELLRLLHALPMPNDIPPISASTGVWITVGESHLTDNELVQRASEAKARAKELGRHRIVVRTERGSQFTEKVYPVEA